MAGVLGFEPRNVGVRVRCLTTWRYPNIKFVKMLSDTDVVTPFGRTTSATWRYPNMKFVEIVSDISYHFI